MLAHNAGLVYLSTRTLALHLHDYAGRMWLGRRRIALQPGDFTLTPAGLPSHYDLAAPGHHLCLHLQALPPPGEAAEGVRLPLHWRPAGHERWLSERLWEIIHLHRRDTPLARQAAGLALQSLLLWLAVTVAERGEGRRRTNRVDASLDAVRRHLDEHLREPLQAASLARRFGVSQNYLSRRFRERHGMTLQRYLLGRRVEFARHLLTVTRLPLKAVAIEAGLGNPQYFHRQFRRATGHSPSEERARSLAAGGSSGG